MPALRLAPELARWAELAAALVNTRPRPTSPQEKLASVEDLDRLLAGSAEPAPAATAGDLEPMRDLRRALLPAFEAPSLDTFANAVNPVLTRATAWRMGVGSGGTWALAPGTRSRPADWFGPRAAHGLAELAITYGLDRLHLCRADDCLQAVVDVSRNGTRRYCSRTCANRTNARRHRQTR